jgi:hypothetical protein
VEHIESALADAPNLVTASSAPRGCQKWEARVPQGTPPRPITHTLRHWDQFVSPEAGQLRFALPGTQTTLRARCHLSFVRSGKIHAAFAALILPAAFQSIREFPDFFFPRHIHYSAGIVVKTFAQQVHHFGIEPGRSVRCLGMVRVSLGEQVRVFPTSAVLRSGPDPPKADPGTCATAKVQARTTDSRRKLFLSTSLPPIRLVRRTNQAPLPAQKMV